MKKSFRTILLAGVLSIGAKFTFAQTERDVILVGTVVSAGNGAMLVKGKVISDSHGCAGGSPMDALKNIPEGCAGGTPMDALTIQGCAGGTPMDALDYVTMIVNDNADLPQIGETKLWAGKVNVDGTIEISQ
jgi:hypothetical protein